MLLTILWRRSAQASSSSGSMVYSLLIKFGATLARLVLPLCCTYPRYADQLNHLPQLLRDSEVHRRQPAD